MYILPSASAFDDCAREIANVSVSFPIPFLDSSSYSVFASYRYKSGVAASVSFSYHPSSETQCNIYVRSENGQSIPAGTGIRYYASGQWK